MHHDSYSGVVVSALEFDFVSPYSEVDTTGVLDFDTDLLAHMSQSANVTFVAFPGFDFAINPVVYVLCQVVCDLAFEA